MGPEWVMGCRALRTRLVAACAGLLLLACPARGSDADARAPGDAPRRRLDLGLYGPPYGAPGREPPAGLRFDAWIDVEGAPNRDLDETMAVWWKHFDFVEPAVYGRDYNLRPNAQPNSVNLLPLFQKLYDKLKK